MYEALFFGTFKSKLKEKGQLTITDNIYKEPAFTQYYDGVAQESMNGDLDYYLSIFTENDRVLEIGTGNGRILKPLLKQGIDIYGIEPEIEMLAFLNEAEKNRVSIQGVETIHLLDHSKKYTYIIIPATSISLFDEPCFYAFLKDVKQLLTTDGKILFDFLSPSCIEGLHEKVTLQKVNNQLFMSGNFVKENKFIYNIYTKKTNGEKKLGYSVKTIYTPEGVNQLCRKLQYTSQVLIRKKDYIMMEVSNDGR